MLGMNAASKLLYRIIKILKVWKVVKNTQQKYYFQKSWESFSNFQKTWNICERALSCVYVCQISCRYLEKRPIFGVLKVENGHFSRDFRRFLHFSDFQNMSDLGRSKSVLRSFFVFLSKTWPKNMYHAAQTQNFQLDLSLTSWPWMTLTLNMLKESLGWYLEMSQTRSMSLYWLICIPTALVRDKARLSKLSHILTLTWPVMSSVTLRST